MRMIPRLWEGVVAWTMADFQCQPLHRMCGISSAPCIVPFLIVHEVAVFRQFAQRELHCSGGMVHPVCRCAHPMLRPTCSVTTSGQAIHRLPACRRDCESDC